MVDGAPDATERIALCDLLTELGPDAPTLLDGWTTRDLAAHLYLREHDLLAAPGLVLPGPWGRFAERHRRGLTERDYADLVRTVRSGPPRGFFRMRWVRRVPNLKEFYVHHEDVRRAQGLDPRHHPPSFDEALWRNVGFVPWFLTRRLHGVGLELVWAGTERTYRARGRSPVARLTGSPGELLLYLFGRRGAAHVELTGPADAVDAVMRSRIGM